MQKYFIILLGLFFSANLVFAQSQELPAKYTEKIASSFYIRAEQIQQVNAYLNKLIANSSKKSNDFFQPDYSSPENYERSTYKYREQLKALMGYPPPGVVENGKKRFVLVGEDSLCTIYRVWVEAMEGVETPGIYMVPRNLQKPAPVVICMHGGGGCPEFVCNFEKPGNYGDMARRALQRGYCTWAPTAIFQVVYAGDPPITGADRQTLDKKAKLVGTSIAAIDIYNIIKGLDAILERPEVDKNRIGMMGLSYGGFYTLYTAALEPRIKVSVSSCYFNDRAEVFGGGGGLNDLHFFNLLNTFADAQVVGLICPRAFMIEVGIQDKLFNIEGSRRETLRAEQYYNKLGIRERYQYVEHSGGHEFRADKGYDFLDKYLK